MDNHYHLLVETPKANLSIGMRQLNGVYTQAFNRRQNDLVHLFQGRYKAILLAKDSPLDAGRQFRLACAPAGRELFQTDLLKTRIHEIVDRRPNLCRPFSLCHVVVRERLLTRSKEGSPRSDTTIRKSFLNRKQRTCTLIHSATSFRR